MSSSAGPIDGSAGAGNMEADEVSRLRPRSVGLLGVLFMVIATTAPIAAATGNYPVSVAFGNGIGAPASYIVVTVTLGLFCIGYVAMARHITAAGAFYGFISNGLSKVLGLASGWAALVGYIAFEAVLVAAFAVFGQIALQEQLHVRVAWPWLALIAILSVGALAHFDLSLAAKVLGVFLVGEMAVLLLTSFGSLFSGGAEGISFEPVNPVNAFKGPAVGLGLLFAFFSFVGFESTAIYGEESREPKRVVPRATYIAVVLMGVFYTFVGWMAITGVGPAHAVAIAESDPFALFFNPAEQYVGHWLVDVYQWLLVTGSFAACLAFHNCAARYLYVFGRDRQLPKRLRLGETHPRHGSPYRASVVASLLAALITAGFWVAGEDPFTGQFTLMGLLGTLALVVVQTFASVSVIAFFNGKRRGAMAWWQTFVAPLLAAVAMAGIVVLLLSNLSAAAGPASTTTLFKLIPWIVLATMLFGAGLALYFRAMKPEIYDRIGRVVFKDEEGNTEEIKLEREFRSDPHADALSVE